MLVVRGRRGFRINAVGLAVSALLSVAGCSSPPTREPESDYAEVKPLLYDYGLVFDCVAESIADEGFQVQLADRDAGTLETKEIPGHEDLLRHVQDGQRIRARVIRTDKKNFIVRLAASRLERESSSNALGEWHYLGPDEALLDRLKKRFDKEVEKRYKPKADKG